MDPAGTLSAEELAARLRALEEANEELRRANARLARAAFARADSAAASALAARGRPEGGPGRGEELERAREEIERLRAELDERGRVIRQMAATRVWRLGERWWRARDGLVRALGLRR